MEAPFKVGQEVVFLDLPPEENQVWGDRPKRIKRGQIGIVLDILFISCDGTMQKKDWYIEFSLNKGYWTMASQFAPIECRPERIKYVAVSEKVREKPVEVANSLRETAVEIAAVETN